MDLSFKEHGKMVRFMERAKLQRKMDKLKSFNGRMEYKLKIEFSI